MDIKKILFKTNEFDVEKSLPDAVIYCNKDGKIQWVDEKTTEVFDTPKMHLLTSNICDFIENAQNMIANTIFLNKAVLVKLLDQEIYFDMTAREVDNGFVLSFRPMSEVKENLQITEDVVDESKNTFLLKIANDFKSPLQSIIGFSQAMTEGLGGNLSIQQEKYIKIINKNSSELMYFISKLMELTQSEKNDIAPELKMFNIVNTINSIVRFNEQLYKDKDVKWIVNIDENVKNTIISNEELIKIALQNILEVLIRSVEMGEISIDYANADEEYIASKNLSGAYMMISISSSSLLLSENDLEYMFEPYKIVDTTNRKNLQRAMMLATVKNIIQSIKGYVWVESVILKKTSFHILIPQGNN